MNSKKNQRIQVYRNIFTIIEFWLYLKNKFYLPTLSLLIYETERNISKKKKKGLRGLR